MESATVSRVGKMSPESPKFKRITHNFAESAYKLRNPFLFAEKGTASYIRSLLTKFTLHVFVRGIYGSFIKRIHFILEHVQRTVFQFQQ